MALTDIVTPPGNTCATSFARGNTGVLVDVQGEPKNMIVIPEAGGGNIFIMSE
jgi:hypothetical protein